MPDLIALAARAPLAEFLESYDASKVGKVKPSTGRTLLHAAVTNPDLAARVAIAERLLDGTGQHAPCDPPVDRARPGGPTGAGQDVIAGTRASRVTTPSA